jgi:hypothetical protein
MNPLVYAVLASLFLGAVATVGDWIWASQSLQHKMIYGIAHGAGFCGAMGLAVGIGHRRAMAGFLGGIVAGVLAAASYYAFAPVLGRSAVLASWAVLWLLLAYLEGPWLRKAKVPGALLRGVLAAAASGAAFYYVTAKVWSGGRFGSGSIDVVDHFWRWTVGFLPGFVALLVTLSVQVRRSSGR